MHSGMRQVKHVANIDMIMEVQDGVASIGKQLVEKVSRGKAICGERLQVYHINLTLKYFLKTTRKRSQGNSMISKRGYQRITLGVSSAVLDDANRSCSKL